MNMPERRIRELLGSLRWQLILLVALSVMSSMMLHGWLTIREQSTLARDGLTGQASALARNLAAASENAILTGQLDVMEQLILNSVGFADVRAIQVFDAQGIRLGHVARRAGESARPVVMDNPRRPELPALPRPRIETLSHAGESRIVAWHPVIAGSLIGWVRVDYSVDSLTHIGQRIWISTIQDAFLAILATGLLLWLMLRRPMRALDEARRFAISLEDAQGQQMRCTEGPTETRELGAALNHASTRLHALRQEVHGAIERLQHHEVLLSDTNHQLQTIISLSADGLAVFDGDGRLKFANRAFHRMTGLASDDATGLDQQTVDSRLRSLCASSDDFPGLAAYFTDSAPNGTADAPDHAPPRKSRLVLSQPVHTVLEISGRLGDSHSTQRVLYLRDVTHETEVDRMKSEFLATAAHELRTPMASIFGFTELMLHRDFPLEQRQRMLGRVHRQSEAMITIIDELLDLSRIEARRGADFGFETLDLGNLVTVAANDFRPAPQRSAPQVLIGAEPLWVRVDPHKIAQVVRNLLTNAYKYSAEHQPVRIAAGIDETGGVELSVSDKGIGMTPEQASRVFERFYRADSAGAVLGAGLGMSIVKEIVDLHGGSIELDTRPGAGTTVRVRMPAVAAPQPDLAAPAPDLADTVEAAGA